MDWKKEREVEGITLRHRDVPSSYLCWSDQEKQMLRADMNFLVHKQILEYQHRHRDTIMQEGRVQYDWLNEMEKEFNGLRLSWMWWETYLWNPRSLKKVCQRLWLSFKVSRRAVVLSSVVPDKGIESGKSKDLNGFGSGKRSINSFSLAWDDILWRELEKCLRWWWWCKRSCDFRLSASPTNFVRYIRIELHMSDDDLWDTREDNCMTWCLALTYAQQRVLRAWLNWLSH